MCRYCIPGINSTWLWCQEKKTYLIDTETKHHAVRKHGLVVIFPDQALHYPMGLFFVVIVQGGERKKGDCDQDREEQWIQVVISGKSGEIFSEFSVFGPCQYHLHVSWRNFCQIFRLRTFIKASQNTHTHSHTPSPVNLTTIHKSLGFE